MLLAEALGAASARNAALVSAYKYGAHSILSRPVTSLALSMADQRKDLGKALSAMAALPGVRDTYAELDIDPIRLGAPPPWSAANACDFLSLVKEAESIDYEILACLAGAFLPLSPDTAEQLASLSEQSRKRASWAQDHLDLQQMCSD
jgi:hypothetical protein